MGAPLPTVPRAHQGSSRRLSWRAWQASRNLRQAGAGGAAGDICAAGDGVSLKDRWFQCHPSTFDEFKGC